MEKLTNAQIMIWLEREENEIHLEQFRKKYNIDPESDVLWQTFSRLVKDGAVKRLGRGWYRRVHSEYDVMNFKHHNPSGYFDIKYPFGLEEYVKTPRRGVVVIGGSPNAGKSAIAHNLVELNWKQHKVILFDTEHSEAELYDRLSNFADFQEWSDDTIRAPLDRQHIEDFIEPDALNIIDYIELPDNIWEIGKSLRNIRDKLGQGVAVVMIQKPEGRDLPYGKEWAKQLPRLVLAMEGGVIKIIKAKVWVKRDLNPDGLRWSFKLVNGEKFVSILSLGKEEKY